jgi:hypothetical protein
MSFALVVSVAACHWSVSLLLWRCSTHTADFEPRPSSASSPYVPASRSGVANPVLDRDCIAMTAAFVPVRPSYTRLPVCTHSVNRPCPPAPPSARW